MLTFVTGDMFSWGAPAAIAHGCNCAGIMGAGVADRVRRRFPLAYAEYRDLCLKREFKLGDVHRWTDGVRTVFNLATQHRPGPFAQLAAIETSVIEMVRLAHEQQIYEIAMPRIGCGIGRLQWDDVRPVLEDVCGDASHVRVVVYDLPR